MNRFTLVLAVLPLAAGCTQNRDFDGAGSTSGANTDSAATDSTPQVTSGESTPTATTAGTDATSPTGSSTSPGTTIEPTTSEPSSSSGDATCVDLDLGTTLGDGIATGSTAGRGNDYTTMECLVSDEGTAFVGPDRSDQEDFVIAWTFPDTGSYVVKSGSGELDVVIGVANAGCEADVLDCDDQCIDAQTALVLTGRAGEQVHLIVEGFSSAGEFSISITEGDDPMCTVDETTGGEFGSSGGGFIAH